MKYVVCAIPMLFSVEWMSWLCLAVMAVMFIADLTLKVEKEKNNKW